MQRKPQVVLAVVVLALAAFGVYQLFSTRSAPLAPIGASAKEQPTETAAVPTSAETQTREVAPTLQRTTATAPSDSQSDLDPSIKAALCGLSGRIVDPEGRPVPDSTVKLLRIAADFLFSPGVGPFAGAQVNAPDPVVGRTKSGSDGRFLIPGVFPHGDFVLCADAEGDAPTWRIVERAVGPGEIADLGDIVLERAGVLTGVVVDESDQPVADALVRAVDLPGTVLSFVPFERFDPKGAILADVPEHRAITMPDWVETRMDDLPIPHTRTDGEGRFRLRGVHPGGNLFAVTKHALLPHLKQRVVVRAGEEKDLGSVRMAEGETAVGKVKDAAGKPVAGAEVLIAGRSLAAPVHFATFAPVSDAEGKFELAGMPAGEVIAAARRSPGDPWFFSEWQPVSRDLLVTLPANGTLTVKCVDEQHAIVAEPRIQLSPGSDEAFIAMTMFGAASPISLAKRQKRGEHGEVIVTDLPLGHYMLLADSPSHATAMQRVELSGETSVEILLKPKATFTVTIRRPDGTPAIGSELFVHPRAEGAPDVPLHAGRADAEGHVAVDVPPGARAQLTAKHPAYGLVSGDVQLPLQTPAELQFAAPGSLNGVVLDKGAAPTPGKFMIYASQRGGRGSAVPQIPLIAAPDLEGKFRFPALAPGDYRVGVAKALGGLRSPGGVMDLVRASWFDDDMPSESVTIVAGQTANLSFDTGIGRRIDGPTVRMSGNVTVDGRLARGHVITVWSRDARQRIVVDNSGRYTVEQVPVGQGYLTLSQPPPEDLFASGGRPLDLWQSNFECVEGKDLELDIEVVTSTIEGVVRTPTGEPVAGADIRANGRLGSEGRRGGNLWRMARSESDGRFRLANLPVGHWSFSAEKSGAGRSPEQEVDVSAGTPTSNVDIVLKPTVHLHGRVELSGLGVDKSKQAYLWLQPRGSTSGRGGYARLKDDGSFEVDDLSDGEFEAQINMQTDKDEWVGFHGAERITVAGRDLEGVIIRAVRDQPPPEDGKR
ncbi:MAG: carboxypeptidase-like regulatory domain-containing protein [Planctomycetota bacterium]